ncbi:MAG: GIY-YIG nuclease family protein [Candidatus Nanohaloarchaea archaeon]
MKSTDLNWSDWASLKPENDNLSHLPTTSGLYKVRHVDREGLEYIGQTGRKLRERVRTLANKTHSTEQPGNAPHTAAPHLWKLIEEIGEGLQVRVANPNVVRSEIDRYGMEYSLVAQHIKDFGAPPTVNLDRGHVLKELGERKDVHRSQLSNIEFQKDEDPLSSEWMGLDWSQPDRIGNRLDMEPFKGVYKIWFENHSPPLAYIGQAKNIRQRMYKHEKKFGEQAKFSAVETQSSRKVVEALLIGTHYQVENTLPKGQEGRRNQFEMEFEHN